MYGHRPVLLFALRQAAEPGPSLTPADLRRHWLNDALSHAVLSQRCDTYVPLAPPVPPTTLPAVRWQPGNLYHTAGILAAAVDTATLPFRLAARLGSGGGTGVERFTCALLCLARCRRRSLRSVGERWQRSSVNAVPTC